MSIPILSIVASVPFYMMWIVGIALAVSRWSRQPTVSALVVTAGALQIVASLGRFLVPMATERLGADHLVLTGVFALLGFISSVGVGLLIGAAFCGRSTNSDPPVT